MKLSHSQPGLWATAGYRCGPQQTGQHGLEVNASIESVPVLGEITVGIFCKIERMIGPTQSGFQVAQQGINPAKAGHIGAAARGANHLGLMVAARGRDAGKTRQTIRDHATLWRQMLLGPGADRLRAKALDPIKTHAHRTTRGIDLDRCNEGYLIFRALPALSAPLTAQVGIVGDHSPAQNAVGFAFPHDLHQFVLDQPGGAVTHSQLALQFDARDVVFRLDHQIHGLKPAHQRQFRGMKDRAGFECALVVAVMALIGLAAVGIHNTVVRTCAVLAVVAVWPAGQLQGLFATLLRTVLLQKFRKTQPRLELDSVHRHGISPLQRTMGLVYRPQWLIP